MGYPERATTQSKKIERRTLMYTNKIPLTPTEVKEVQDQTLDQLGETTIALTAALTSAKEIGPEGLSSHKWGLIGSLIENLKETYIHADWKLKTGRSKGYNWKGEYDETTDKETQ
jgi:hypothetical protein